MAIGPQRGTRLIGILSSTRRDGPWQPSRNTQAIAVLGSCKLDLRRAEFDSELEVAAVAVFGSVDIIVGPGTEVELSGTLIFGSKEVKGEVDGSDGRDRIRVNATSVFGGVTVARRD